MQLKLQIKQRIQITQFQIQEPITSLLVSVKANEGVKAYLLLYNPNSILCGFMAYGLSNFIDEIYISQEFCTLNGLSHTLQEGEYALVVATISDIAENTILDIEVIENETIDFDERYCERVRKNRNTLKDEIVDRRHGYYKGDFHGHTIYSDGHNSILEASHIIDMQNLDFMAFTEHNAMPLILKKLPCLEIPSFELTLPIGHMNIHGVKDIDTLWKELSRYALEYSKSIKSMLIENTQSLLYKIWDMAINTYAKEANISLNHMFMEPWHFQYDEFDMKQLNTIEIICDPTYPSAQKANDKAVAFLDYLWTKGLRIYGIGGSDSHNKLEEYYEGSNQPSIYGDPSTYVFCKGLSRQNIINSIKNGNAYVTRSINMEINICNDKYLPGDQIPSVERKITYEVVVKDWYEDVVGRFIRNDEVVKEVRIQKKDTKITFNMKNGTSYWWLRFGIYDSAGHVLSYVNPIYNIKKECKQNTTLKKLTEQFGEYYD